MEDKEDKLDCLDIIVHIDELMSQIEVTQNFKNKKKIPIELELLLPTIESLNITRFELIKENQKIISKILEKEKAKEKYSDTITQGDSGFVSYTLDDETKICLGNVSPNEEIELKTFYFGHITIKDLSLQAKFPVIFPKFVLEDPSFKEEYDYYKYENITVKGKIYINTRSKLTRLVIKDSKNYTKIEKKFSEDKLSAEIDFLKNNFSDKDIPGLILFRTEQINDEVLYFQSDPRKNKSYYILQKTLSKPEFNFDLKGNIDEDKDKNYTSMIKNKEEEDKKQSKICYIFLLDQSGSMDGERMKLSCKSLLLFLQSLNENCYIQLIGFGSNYEFFSEEPLEYNKQNIKDLMEKIKKLDADKGGTELYEPLKKIYDNPIYDKYKMKKSIILLTDGELDDKQKVLNLISANSERFIFNSIGIGSCDKDLIERSALNGNGYSYYISKLNELNEVVISLLEKAQNCLSLSCKVNQKCFIEDKNEFNINKNDLFKFGFILEGKNIKNIEFEIGNEETKTKLYFDTNKIIKLPDGDNLGKLIVDNYLQGDKCKNKNLKISLSKDFKILTNETAFYAKITNEIPSKDKMVLITNKNKVAENIMYGYDKDDLDEEQSNGKKKNWFIGFFSNLFNFIKDNIIKKKNYKLKTKKEKKRKLSRKAFALKESYECCYASPDDDLEYRDDYEIDCGYRVEVGDYGDDLGFEYRIPISSSSTKKEIEDKNEIKEIEDKNEIKEIDDKKEIKEIEEKKIQFNFDEFILGQDIIDGNWTNNPQCEALIDLEKDLYNKIKQLAEKKGINDENGIITLFALFFIYNKKSDKINEFKFVINKAKNYVKKIFNANYEDIVKEIEN